MLAFALAVAACDTVPAVAPGPTHVDGIENQPGPGLVVVVGDPPNATASLVIEFVASDGCVVEGRTARVSTGGLIEATMFNLPGQTRLRVNGKSCDGDLVFESDTRTNVVLRVSDAGCSVETRGMEPL